MQYPALHRILPGFLAAFLFLSAVPSFSEELHNLEIVFRKSYTEWDPDTIKAFGSGLCAAGDVNGDGYDDFAAEGWDYRVSPAGWRSIVFVFYGGTDLDTIPDVLLEDDYWGGSGGGGITGGT
jgi:hypothetical protein